METAEKHRPPSFAYRRGFRFVIIFTVLIFAVPALLSMNQGPTGSLYARVIAIGALVLWVYAMVGGIAGELDRERPEIKVLRIVMVALAGGLVLATWMNIPFGIFKFVRLHHSSNLPSVIGFVLGAGWFGIMALVLEMKLLKYQAIRGQTLLVMVAGLAMLGMYILFQDKSGDLQFLITHARHPLTAFSFDLVVITMSAAVAGLIYVLHFAGAYRLECESGAGQHG